LRILAVAGVYGTYNQTTRRLVLTLRRDKFTNLNKAYHGFGGTVSADGLTIQGSIKDPMGLTDLETNRCTFTMRR
jgi:hypothetical protein